MVAPWQRTLPPYPHETPTAEPTAGDSSPALHPQVGIPGGNAVMHVPLQDLVFSQKHVVGSIVGGRADMQEMLNFSAVHNVKPLLELWPLSKVGADARGTGRRLGFVATGG